MIDSKAVEALIKDTDSEKVQVSRSTQIVNVVIALIAFGLGIWWFTELMTS